MKLKMEQLEPELGRLIEATPPWVEDMLKRGVGSPPDLSGWACGPRIVMKKPWGRPSGVPSAPSSLSGRPDRLSIAYGGFSTVRGSSRTRPSASEAPPQHRF